MRKLKNVSKRLLALVLALALVVGYIPARAEAAELTTGVLLKAVLSYTTTDDVYSVKVTDKDGADVTNKATITWPDGSIGNSYSTSNESEIVQAFVAYDNIKLSVDSIDNETEWTATIDDWADIVAGNVIAAPEISGDGHSSFSVTPTWKVKDKDDNDVTGKVAKVAMGQLTATVEIAGYTYTAETTVTPAPIEVTDVTPKAGWYAVVPTVVTVTGDNDVTLEDSVKTIEIGKTTCNWNDEEKDDPYSTTFNPEANITYNIGGKDYTWQVDAVEPEVKITSAYVNDEGVTVVNYSYTVGPSGGTIFCESEPVAVEEGMDEGTFTISGARENVIVTITNNLLTPATASDNRDVDQKPNDITTSGYIAIADDVTYVANDAELTFTYPNAVANVKWYIEDSEVSDCTANKLTVALDAGYYDRDLTIKAVDAYGRTKSITLPTITVDMTPPDITITPPEDETAGYTDIKYFDAERTYTIKITDNAALGEECSATATINGEVQPIPLNNGVGEVKITDAQTLTEITVNAEDKNNNTTVETYTTNVCVDTTDPVITGTISINYYNEETGEYNQNGEIKSLYNSGNKIYLVLDSAANNENDDGSKKVQVQVVYTLDETNPDGVTGNWDGKTYTVTQVVEKDQVVEIDLSVSAKDLAGRVPTVLIDLGQNITLENPNDGVYTKKITVDRRTPEDAANDPLTTAPNVTLSVDSAYSYTDEEAGFRYFKDKVDFTMQVMDSASGLADANITVTATGEGITGAQDTGAQDIALDANGKATISMSIDAGKEHKEGKIDLKIYDKVGNYYYYNETFGVDTLAPRVSVTVASDDEEVSTVGRTDFYQKPVTLTFKLEDMLPSNAIITYSIYSIDGVEQKNITLSSTNPEPTSITVAYGEVLTALSVRATDAIGNTTTSFSGYTFDNKIEVDGTPAVVTIVMTPDEEATVVDADDVSYYSSPVTVEVSVSDKNITSAGGTAKLKYTIDGVEKEADIFDEVSFKVENNKVLESLNVEVVDNAGNKTAMLNGADYSEADGIVSYTGDKIAVDDTNPVVTVVKKLDEKTNYVQTIDGTAYYDGSVEYIITITDEFLNKEASIIAIDGVVAEAQYTPGTKLSDKDTLTLTVEVTDEDALSGIEITSLDMIGLTAEAAVVTDPLDTDDLTFTKDENTENTLKYTGPKVVVDTKAPEAELILTGNIDALVEKNGVYYVKLKTPVSGLGAVFSGIATEEVTLTLTVKDANLSLNKEKDGTYMKDGTYILSNDKNKTWSLNDGVATYTDTVNVALHHTDYFVIDVAAYDLVGHPMKLDAIKKSEGEGNIIKVDAEGTFKATISVDRRTPSSTDGEVPSITLTDGVDADKKFKTLSGLDLYSSTFNFTANVEDGKGTNDKEGAKPAGLQSVTWKLEDETGAVETGDGTIPYKDYTSQDTVTVNVHHDKVEGETDDGKLTITAIDNVGNTITYSKDFAYDDLGPRITVTIDGDSVKNNKYYNKTRTAVVEVTDLHMPELAELDKFVTIETQGTAGDWTQDGNTYRKTYTFDADGMYTFSVKEAKDIAGNTTTKVTYNGENPTDFVIDKTAPVISVTYNPAVPSGKDGTINHYDKNLTAYFSIKETNFDANDVVDKFVNSGHNLVPGSWNNNGDNHTASAVFNEGNNYSFSIDFTDLAGNQAAGYKSFVFCVDLHAPTINITKGDLTTKELNIIQDDLTLGVTINDEQKNLSNYSVTVTHLDNNFKKTTVTGKDYYTVTTLEDRTTVTVDFAKIAAVKENDGLYTVEITAQDYAGHKVTLGDGLDFSLNRFGSTFYSEDDYTLEFLTTGSDGNAYHRIMDNKLIVKELNPNKVYTDSTKKSEGSVLTVMVNGTSTKLIEGKDYKMSVSEEGTGTNKWYVYTYEIDPETFEDSGTVVDGRYSILIYGEDAAGNKNTNESNDSGKLQKNVAGEYNGKIEFTLDATAPIITTTGIESGKTYNAAAQKLEIFLSDNTPTGIAVYVNGELIKLSEEGDSLADTATYLVWDELNGCYVLNVPEQDGIFDSQNVKAVATDAAGNMSEEAIEDFIVSTSFIVRWLNSVWFYLILALLIAAAAALGIVIFRKKKA